MIRNPTANRTSNIQKLKSRFILCLTGTPFQNRLTDVQSLIFLLKIWPWNQEWIWKTHLIPGINVGSQEAIQTLNRLMETVCLRRTKDVLLNLPSKIEKVVVVSLGAPWDDFSRGFHQSFIQYFGRLRSSGEPWDSTEFFKQLTMIRQFCNHPVFARDEIPHQRNWRWQDSAKLVHLVDNLDRFLRGGRGIVRPKAVVFSSFVAFLEM
jgi:SNF2 family DNA or RNA helicase